MASILIFSNGFKDEIYERLVQVYRIPDTRYCAYSREEKHMNAQGVWTEKTNSFAFECTQGFEVEKLNIALKNHGIILG